MLYPNKTGKLFRHLMPSCTWQVNTTKREIYLTFDDGPIPEVTEWVLDTLSTFKIKATFFCVGDNIRKNPLIFKKIIEAGHAVGNHTFNHLKGWKTSNTEYFSNIELWEKTVSGLGFISDNKLIFRPPYGQITFSQAKALKEKYEIIMWDIITGDFDKSLNRQKCLQQCIKLTSPGSVIVFHDSLKAKNNLQYILPQYIETMINEGYTFAKW